MGFSLLPGFGPSGPGQDNWYKNIGVVPQTKDEKDIKAGALPLSVTGTKREEGEEVYIEIKGPAKLGERSSMPYQKVLPKYKRRAEEALGKQKIPAEHQKRVKEYFNSLQGGG